MLMTNCSIDFYKSTQWHPYFVGKKWQRKILGGMGYEAEK